MKESSYDFDNSMEQEEYEEEIYEETDKNKAIEKANNTMIASNKKEATTKKKKKHKKSKEKEEEKINKERPKKENKIDNIINEINDELEDYTNLDIDNILEINKKYNYPKEFPLFYIQDEMNNIDNKLTKEPLSANKLKELLKYKKIKPYVTNIKLIDIFTMKNYEPFSFFPLNDILNKNWSDNVEYSNLFMNVHNKLNEKEKIANKKIEIFPKEEPIIEKKVKKENNKIDVIPKKEPIKLNKEKKENQKENDMSFSMNFSVINNGGFNDLSMSIIKHLEGINLAKKQYKITSIVEAVEEDDWEEIKSKKKEIEEKSSICIVGLNENKKAVINNKKNQKNQKKKNKFKDNNQFKGLKVDYED